MPAAAVLRRALFVWGLGHIALGDPRGWLLLLLQPLAVASAIALTAAFIDGTRWILVFPAVAVVLGAWIWQAMDAHRQAIRRGGAPGGELQIAVLLPLAAAILSGFWLVGGARSSPATTVQHYVAAWQANQPAAAETLFAQAIDDSELQAEWARQSRHIQSLVESGASQFGPAAGLDPDQPFNSLRFEPLPSQPAADHRSVVVDLVRRRRVETNLLGFIPTATQETVVIQRLGQISLRSYPAPLPEWLPLAENPSLVWLIDEVVIHSPAD